jgi:isocitrate lyase
MGFNVEKSDLNVELSFALVCHGKMCDFLKVREDIRKNYPDVKLVFNTVSAEYLFILKKNALTPQQLKVFEKEGSKKNGTEKGKTSV